jgi:hypothetical protein
MGHYCSDKTVGRRTQGSVETDVKRWDKEILAQV